jgi:hypothetical protein
MTMVRNVRLELALLALVVGWTLPAGAANRFFVENKQLLVSQNGVNFNILCDNDVPVYGVSVAVKYETTKINITKVELAGAWSAPPANNDVWSDLKFDNATGDLICGAVYDFSPTGVPANDNVIPVGTNHAILTLTVNVLAASATTTLVDFRDGLGTRAIKNVMTNSTAASLAPTLSDQTLTITDPKPVIQRPIPAGNSGLAGKEFFVKVTNLGPPNTTIGVEVCAKVLVRNAADGFKLLADGQTLSIIAPACGTVGFSPLKVTTDFGSDTEPNGFKYDPVVVEKKFTRGDTNNDGIVDLADAISIFNDLFLGIPALAPCRDALDTDDTGILDLTDGIKILLFLFQTGEKDKPAPPFPDPGVDPTPDDPLAPCL